MVMPELNCDIQHTGRRELPQRHFDARTANEAVVMHLWLLGFYV